MHASSQSIGGLTLGPGGDSRCHNVHYSRVSEQINHVVAVVTSYVGLNENVEFRPIL